MFQLINDQKPNPADRKLKVLEGGAVLAVLSILGVVLWWAFKTG